MIREVNVGTNFGYVLEGRRVNGGPGEIVKVQSLKLTF